MRTAPLTSRPGTGPGSCTLSVALPAVEVTVAPRVVSSSRATPAWKTPRFAVVLASASDSVAGTVPDTSVATGVSLAGSPGAHECAVNALPGTLRQRLGLVWLGGSRSFVACS